MLLSIICVRIPGFRARDWLAAHVASDYFQYSGLAVLGLAAKIAGAYHGL